MQICPYLTAVTGATFSIRAVRHYARVSVSPFCRICAKHTHVQRALAQLDAHYSVFNPAPPVQVAPPVLSSLPVLQ